MTLPRTSKGTPKKFKIVRIDLLVPEDDDSYSDRLSDLRDDHPDQVVQWAQVVVVESGHTAECAAEAWRRRHDDVVVIPVEAHK